MTLGERLRRQEHSDAEDQAQDLTAWRHRYRQLSPGAFRGEVEEMRFGPVLVYRERLNRAVLQCGSACPDTVLVGGIVDMEGEGFYNGSAFDRPVLLASRPGAAFEFRTPVAHEVLACGVAREAVESYAATVARECASGLLSRLPEVGWNPAGACRLREIFGLAQAVSGHALPARALAQAEQEIRERVLAYLLDCCGSVGDAAFPRIAATRYRVFRRADQYIQDHAGEAIGIEALCRVSHASRRTLQYCFESVVGMGPLAYVRNVRLNGVRGELRRRCAEPESINDIAARWGFWHFSRFAAQYRALFGELPSRTLQLARSA